VSHNYRPHRVYAPILLLVAAAFCLLPLCFAQTRIQLRAFQMDAQRPALGTSACCRAVRHLRRSSASTPFCDRSRASAIHATRQERSAERCPAFHGDMRHHAPTTPHEGKTVATTSLRPSSPSAAAGRPNTKERRNPPPVVPTGKDDSISRVTDRKAKGKEGGPRQHPRQQSERGSSSMCRVAMGCSFRCRRSKGTCLCWGQAGWFVCLLASRKAASGRRQRTPSKGNSELWQGIDGRARTSCHEEARMRRGYWARDGRTEREQTQS
jgi:hypothetical protein